MGCYGARGRKDVLYEGNLSVTRNGFKCLNWAKDGYDLVLNENHNFCRNPLGSDFSRSGRPWCYVSQEDSDRGYDWCDVKVCDGSEQDFVDDEEYLKKILVHDVKQSNVDVDVNSKNSFKTIIHFVDEDSDEDKDDKAEGSGQTKNIVIENNSPKTIVFNSPVKNNSPVVFNSPV